MQTIPPDYKQQNYKLHLLKPIITSDDLQPTVHNKLINKYMTNKAPSQP